MRLDQFLVHQNLIDTRTKAKSAIQQGSVYCDGQQITKPSFEVTDNTQVEMKGCLLPYVSRGGLKLEKALNDFQIDLSEKIVLDIGSSTGGFTDCALQHKAKSVIAVDVGTNQLAPVLRTNPAVIVYEQTDFRTISTEKINACQIAVSDVSFISVTKMIPKLQQIENLTDLICLIKPQFECGKETADKYKGIIKNPKIHIQVLTTVIATFEENGFHLHHLTVSPIKGTSGNTEYLAHFKKEPSNFSPNINELTQKAFQK